MGDVKLSVIVPAYREPFLIKTLESVLRVAGPSTEVIAVLDGWWTEDDMPFDPRLHVLYYPANIGMRGAMNRGIEAAKGRLIMKLDAHCAVPEGFDRVLVQAHREPDTLIIPRRYSLDAENWWIDSRRPARDHHYICFPHQHPIYGLYMGPGEAQLPAWKNETMSFQGSSWVADRRYWMKHIHPLDDAPERYGSFAQDQQEIGLKYWLGGGRIMVNTDTWYAHLSKRGHHYGAGMFSRKYKVHRLTRQQNTWGTLHWLHNEEPGMKYPFEWLVEKFWPVPSWPDNWKDLLVTAKGAVA